MRRQLLPSKPLDCIQNILKASSFHTQTMCFHRIVCLTRYLLPKTANTYPKDNREIVWIKQIPATIRPYPVATYFWTLFIVGLVALLRPDSPSFPIPQPKLDSAPLVIAAPAMLSFLLCKILFSAVVAAPPIAFTPMFHNRPPYELAMPVSNAPTTSTGLILPFCTCCSANRSQSTTGQPISQCTAGDMKCNAIVAPSAQLSASC